MKDPVYYKLIVDITLDRLLLLLNSDVTNKTPQELVQQGYCDPVRIFVKNEPHKADKVANKRWRLISSVSIVDQLVDRVLNTHINKTEIANWHKIPSKPGMGFNQESVEKIIQDFESIPDPCTSDISGFDWCTAYFALKADCEYRIRSCLTRTKNMPKS